MDTRQLILDTAVKIFSDHCDKALWDAAEQGEFAHALWQQVAENGFHLLGTDASGTDAADLFAFLKVCGRYAVPLPMAEVLLANVWLTQAGKTASALDSIGIASATGAVQVPWGRRATQVLAVSPDSHGIALLQLPAEIATGQNIAGEPVDSLTAAESGEMLQVTDSPYAQMALARVNLMAGGLQTALDLGLQFDQERSQFGRSISKFQAIQHSLAVVAAEVAAAQRAADAGVDALGSDRFVEEVAAAKARVGEAVGIVAEQVHQVHGAMGFTYEHRLHHFTRRLWSWRDDWGNEFYWQTKLGASLAGLGADQVWNYIATRA